MGMGRDGGSRRGGEGQEKTKEREGKGSGWLNPLRNLAFSALQVYHTEKEKGIRILDARVVPGADPHLYQIHVRHQRYSGPDGRNFQLVGRATS